MMPTSLRSLASHSQSNCTCSMPARPRSCAISCSNVPRLNRGRRHVDLERRRERVLIELRHELAHVREVALEARQRLGARDEPVPPQVAVRRQIGFHRGDLLRRGVGIEVDVHARCALPAQHRLLQVLGDQHEGAEDEEGHGDHGDGDEARALRRPDPPHRLLEESRWWCWRGLPARRGV